MIICPSKEKQLKFEAIFFKLKEVENKLSQSLSVLQKLFRSVLHGAFNPNEEIDEDSIFKDLIKKLTVEDLRENKMRLKSLLKLINENKFDNNDDYIDAKNKLFKLILSNEIEQKSENDKITLQVK